jgi:hypothetical protein
MARNPVDVLGLDNRSSIAPQSAEVVLVRLNDHEVFSRGCTSRHRQDRAKGKQQRGGELGVP